MQPRAPARGEIAQRSLERVVLAAARTATLVRFLDDVAAGIPAVRADTNGAALVAKPDSEGEGAAGHGGLSSLGPGDLCGPSSPGSDAARIP